MTSNEASGAVDETGDSPGWALPKTAQTPTAQPDSPLLGEAAKEDDNQPLTATQQAVVNEVTVGQEALRREMRWGRRSTWSLLGGLGSIGYTIDSALGSRAAIQVSESEREAEFLAPPPTSSDEVLHVPAGGPPTPEEVHEAEMNPWPHHGMAETIERNRQLRANPGGEAEGVPPPAAT
jgi:hypothetical protein